MDGCEVHLNSKVLGHAVTNGLKYYEKNIFRTKTFLNLGLDCESNRTARRLKSQTQQDPYAKIISLQGKEWDSET